MDNFISELLAYRVDADEATAEMHRRIVDRCKREINALDYFIGIPVRGHDESSVQSSLDDIMPVEAEGLRDYLYDLAEMKGLK